MSYKDGISDITKEFNNRIFLCGVGIEITFNNPMYGYGFGIKCTLIYKPFKYIRYFYAFMLHFKGSDTQDSVIFKIQTRRLCIKDYKGIFLNGFWDFVFKFILIVHPEFWILS